MNNWLHMILEFFNSIGRLFAVVIVSWQAVVDPFQPVAMRFSSVRHHHKEACLLIKMNDMWVKGVATDYGGMEFVSIIETGG